MQVGGPGQSVRLYAGIFVTRQTRDDLRQKNIESAIAVLGLGGKRERDTPTEKGKVAFRSTTATSEQAREHERKESNQIGEGADFVAQPERKVSWRHAHALGPLAGGRFSAPGG